MAALAAFSPTQPAVRSAVLAAPRISMQAPPEAPLGAQAANSADGTKPAAAAAAAVTAPGSDWGGLPAAMIASKCGAINSRLVKSRDAEEVLTLTDKNKKQLNAVNAATALHRIASHLKKTRAQRDRVLRDPRFLELLDIAEDRAPLCNPRSVSDTLWAFATLQHWPPKMLTPLLTRVAVHLEANAFEAQHLALIVWAFAVLELKPTKLLDRIEACSISQLPSFRPQNCANLLWGFAKLNYKPTQLLPKMTSKLAAPDFLATLKPVEIADASFALAIIGTPEAQGALLNAFATRVTPGDLLEECTSRQLVTLTWAFARMGAAAPSEMNGWVERIKEEHASTPLLAQDQKNVAAALTRLGMDTEWLNPPEEEEEEQGATMRAIRERILG